MKKWFSALLCFMLVGCGSGEVQPSASSVPFMSEYTELEENLVYEEGDHESVDMVRVLSISVSRSAHGVRSTHRCCRMLQVKRMWKCCITTSIEIKVKTRNGMMRLPV